MSDPVELTIYQGATWNSQFQWFNDDATPIDLTGYTGRMQLRRVITDASPAFELTTSNGRMTLDAQGRVSVTISATDTATLSGEYVFDCEVISGAVVTRLLRGTITVIAEVTR